MSDRFCSLDPVGVGDDFISIVGDVSSMSWGDPLVVGHFCIAAMKALGHDDVYALPLGTVYGIMALSVSLNDRVAVSRIEHDPEYFLKRGSIGNS